MNLVKGIASVVGLGGIATAIGLGVSSSPSSSQTSKVPELKKTTVRERLSSGKIFYSFLGFDDRWDLNWKSSFGKYQSESNSNNKFSFTISNWEGLRDKCKEIYDSTIDEEDSNFGLFKKWCIATG